MKVLKYKQGQERGPYIEKSEYEDSIFRDQYVQALTLINGFLSSDNREDSSLKCVAFCGDRGEGKTSCMGSVREILNSYHIEDSESRIFLDNRHCERIIKSKAAVIDIIDPSFFDDTHNVLEIVIGQLYNTYRTKERSSKIELKNKLLKDFTDVNSSLESIKENDYDSLNSLHKLSVLATNMRLRQQIASLVTSYLEYFNSHFLIVSVDDIDINVVHAYKMCEQIRKYLCVPNCIVLISFKIEQLQDVVAQAMKRSIGTPGSSLSFFPDDKIVEMAKKYINKFIPLTSRVEMPKAYDLVDIAVRNQTPGDPIITLKCLKESIVKLIYSRTRYLFYNPFDGVSPIVPKNLRDVVNLLGLLFSMDEIPNSRDPEKADLLLNNKHLFKYFFYSVWKNQFDDKLQKKIDELIHFDFGTSFNREIISLLWGRFEKYLSKDYNTPTDENPDQSENENVQTSPNVIDKEIKKYLQRINRYSAIPSTFSFSSEMLKSIVNSGNFGYNLTIGDVFYIFNFLESETLNESEFALIFLLKSLYSIKLYESYEYITEENGKIYPAEDDERIGLSIIDHRFDFSNKLQQLIGGSYFTYCPGYLLPGGNPIALDLRILSGRLLNSILSDLKEEYPKIKTILEKEKIQDKTDFKGKAPLTGVETEDDKRSVWLFFEELNVVEFFILTTRCAVSHKYTDLSSGNIEVIKALDLLRRNVIPFHYAPFAPKTGFYLFDITAPFANLVNPEYAYRRFERIDKEFYEFIKNTEGSLLNQIMRACDKGRDYINHPEDSNWTILHRLLSDCVIRNAEVLTSLTNNMLARRRITHDSGWINFFSFYRNFNSSGMKTQPTSSSTDPDYIAFNFLKPLDAFLKSIEDDKDKSTTLRRDLFFCIFDSRVNATNEPNLQNPDSQTMEPPISTIETPLTEEYINSVIGKSRKPNIIRQKISEIPFFSSMSEEELKEIIPDLDNEGQYSPADAKAIVWNWIEKRINDVDEESETGNDQEDSSDSEDGLE